MWQTVKTERRRLVPAEWGRAIGFWAVVPARRDRLRRARAEHPISGLPEIGT
jgi:hypothetical protein